MDKENKSRKFTVRFTDEEFKILEEKFKKSNKKNMSDFIRKSAINSKVIETKELENLRYEVRKIGVNIHQILKNVHMTNLTFTQIEELEKDLEELNKIWDLLKNYLQKHQ